MPDRTKRLDALRDRLRGLDLDAVIIVEPHNRAYLSGFTGSNGIAVVGPDTASIVTDSRYYGRVRREAPGFVLVEAGNQMYSTLEETVMKMGAHRVGFEAHVITVEAFERLREAVPDVEWVPAGPVVDSLRAIKDEDEIDAIARAAAITDRAMAWAYNEAAPGMTEVELAWGLEVFIREAGAEALAFDTIVAAGANGALPHHQSGHTRLAPGEPVLIDMGAKVEGYCADLTRTFSLGPASDPEFDTVWHLVDEANRRVIEGLRPGMTGRDVDAIARDHIAAAGFGDAFGHGLGHGVGLNIHELPRVNAAAGDVVLETGMVVTIEPGVYLPDRFGIRIEDLAVIRPDGLQVLSSALKMPTSEPTTAQE